MFQCFALNDIHSTQETTVKLKSEIIKFNCVVKDSLRNSVHFKNIYDVALVRRPAGATNKFTLDSRAQSVHSHLVDRQIQRQQSTHKLHRPVQLSMRHIRINSISFLWSVKCKTRCPAKLHTKNKLNKSTHVEREGLEKSQHGNAFCQRFTEGS